MLIAKLYLFAIAAVIQLSSSTLQAQQISPGPSTRTTHSSIDLKNDSQELSESKNPMDLPILRLGNGYHLNRTLGTNDWIRINISGLSQNNTTISGLSANQYSSSNLFNLGLQLGPFYRSSSSTRDLDNQTTPRVGMEKSKSSRFYHRLLLNALFTQRAGQILSNEIPNVLNTQWNFGNGPIARLNILNLEYRNPSGLISSIKAGKLMQAQDFTVNPVQCFFSNFGLCGWAQGTPSMVQVPGNPFNSYGAVLKIGSENNVRLKYGVYQLSPETYKPQYHGFNFRFDQSIGTAHFLELNMPLNSPKLLPVNTILLPGFVKPKDSFNPNALYESPLPPTTLTLGGWFATGKFGIVKSDGVSSTFDNKNSAIYGIASIRLPFSWLGMDHRLFAASSIGFTPDVQNYRSGGNTGLIIAGLIPTRPFDTFGFGAAYAVFNPSYYYGGADPSSYTPSSEIALEINYNIAINKSISIMPNFQYIIQPSGNPSRSGVSVLGLQMWLRF